MYVRKHLKITYLWILYSNTQSSQGKYQSKKSLSYEISNSGNVWNGYNWLHKILQGKLAFIYRDIIEKHLDVYPKWISQISFKNWECMEMCYMSLGALLGVLMKKTEQSNTSVTLNYLWKKNSIYKNE